MKVDVALDAGFTVVHGLPSCAQYDDWVSWVLQALRNIELNTGGLGEGFLAGGGGAACSADDALWWTARVNERLRRRPLARVELRAEPVAPREQEGCIDRHWLLGSYSARQRLIVLYPAAIVRAAAGLPESMRVPVRDVMRMVLLHELGHHVSPGDEQERQDYDSANADAATSRLETAAQGFAWLTSDDTGRSVLEHLSQGVSPAYRAYQALFGVVREPQVGPCVPQLGWLSAWQLSQFPSCADVPLPAQSVPLTCSRWAEFAQAVASASRSMKAQGVQPWPVVDPVDWVETQEQQSPQALAAKEFFLFASTSCFMFFLDRGEQFDGRLLEDWSMSSVKAGLFAGIGLVSTLRLHQALNLRLFDDLAVQSGRVERYASGHDWGLTDPELWEV